MAMRDYTDYQAKRYMHRCGPHTLTMHDDADDAARYFSEAFRSLIDKKPTPKPKQPNKLLLLCN